MAFEAWPILNSFSLVLAPGNRSKIYLQNFLAHQFRPSHVILLGGAEGEASETRRWQGVEEYGIRFDENEPLSVTLKRQGIPYDVTTEIDPNAEEVVARMQGLPDTYVVYSGPPGAILKPNTLKIGKIFLHAHPGRLPAFRGSTTIYYTLLAKEPVVCSIIALNEQIDAGPLLFEATYPVVRPEDLDYVVGPSMRAATFLGFFKKTWGKPPEVLQRSSGEDHNFYIIHPVLKHLAILNAGKHSLQTSNDDGIQQPLAPYRTHE